VSRLWLLLRRWTVYRRGPLPWHPGNLGPLSVAPVGRHEALVWALPLAKGLSVVRVGPGHRRLSGTVQVLPRGRGRRPDHRPRASSGKLQGAVHRRMGRCDRDRGAIPWTDQGAIQVVDWEEGV